MKRLALSIILFFLAITAFSQVRGVVKDCQGNALAGANVVGVGTNHGTTTDGNGNFVLERQLDVNSLVTSFIGYINDNVKNWTE